MWRADRPPFGLTQSIRVLQEHRYDVSTSLSPRIGRESVCRCHAEICMPAEICKHFAGTRTAAAAEKCMFHFSVPAEWLLVKLSMSISEVWWILARHKLLCTFDLPILGRVTLTRNNLAFIAIFSKMFFVFLFFLCFWILFCAPLTRHRKFETYRPHYVLNSTRNT